MTAKEMFEELGYEFNDYSNENNKDDDLYAIYVYEIRQWKGFSPDVLFKEIAFFPNLKKVQVYCNEEFNYDNKDLWSAKELKAINKQIEELGWE